MFARRRFCQRCFAAEGKCTHAVAWDSAWSVCQFCNSEMRTDNKLGGNTYCVGCVGMYLRQWAAPAMTGVTK